MTDTQLITIPLHYERDTDEKGNEITTQLLVKNMPGEIHRKLAAAQSLDGFLSTVEIVDIFHGSTIVSKNGYEYDKGATFICFKFRFLRTKGFSPSRTFRQAIVTLTFEDQLHRADMEPEISMIAPEASVVSNITPVGNEALQRFQAMHSGVGFAIQNKTTTESKAMATIKGVTTFSGNRLHGNRNMVTWRIDENPAVKNGISDSYEAGLLLFREPDNSRFVMKAEISVYVDKRHQALGLLERWRGKQSEDDPVIFDPSTQLGQQTDEVKDICSSLPEHMRKYSQGFLPAQGSSP